jgi:cobalamin biosynthesis Mg chelatase CobN
MKWTIIVLALLMLIGCRSVKKTAVSDYQHTDSTSYSKIVTVDIDTTVIASDSATLEATLTQDEFGKLFLEGVKQNQGNGISVDYSIQKTPEGKTMVTIKAKTTEKEVYTTNKTVEEKVDSQISTSQEVITETKKTGVSFWNLTWIIPIGLVILVIILYLNRKKIILFISKLISK